MDYKQIMQEALNIEGRAQLIWHLANQIDYENAADYMETEKKELEEEVRKLLKAVQDLLTAAEFLPW